MIQKTYINGCSTVMLKVDRVGFGLDHCPQKFTMGGAFETFSQNSFVLGLEASLTVLIISPTRFGLKECC